MKTKNEIRSIGLARLNKLVRATPYLESLRPAFAEWSAGEIYVCKKTGCYRYRHGERSKSVAPWSAVARTIFDTPEAFAFAAVVLGADAPQLALPAPAAPAAGRANIIQMQEAA